MRIVELILGDDELTGIEVISVVENPAIEEDFIALKSEEIKLISRAKRNAFLWVLYLFLTNLSTVKKEKKNIIFISQETQ